MSHDVWILKQPADGGDPLRALESGERSFEDVEAVRAAFSAAFPSFELNADGYGGFGDANGSFELQVPIERNLLSVWIHGSSDAIYDGIAAACRERGWLVFDDGEYWEL